MKLQGESNSVGSTIESLQECSEEPIEGSAKPRGASGVAVRLSALLFLLILVLPNLIWILLDKTAWAWDFAWYGQGSVNLYYALVYKTSSWPFMMKSVLGRQAPGLVWFGQFFVPLGQLLGSIDKGLLFSVVAAQFLTLVVTRKALAELTNPRSFVPLFGGLFLAAAPLSVALSHYYLVETLQTLAVAWFVLIMACAPKWPRTLVVGQLAAATALAMLAKVSSPLFCVGPGLLSLYYVVRRSESGDCSSLDDRLHRLFAWVTALVALPALFAAGTWYNHNLEFVKAHVKMASTGRVAALYGREDGFLPSLVYWLRAINGNFFVTFALIFAVAVVGWFVVASIRGGLQPRHRLAALVAASQLMLILVVFAMHSNRDNRFLAPAIPYVVLLVCLGLERVGRKELTFAAFVVFGIQFAVVHGTAFGVIGKSSSMSEWLNAINLNRVNLDRLDGIVSRTSAPYGAFNSNTVTVQLLEINAPALNYTAAKRYAPAGLSPCDYQPLGYYEVDIEAAWSKVLGRTTGYVIAVDPATHPAPATPTGSLMNQMNEPILSKVQASGLFVEQEPLEQDPAVRIFWRENWVAAGRTHLDQGNVDQAVSELRQATTEEPANVEAWANLALAYERKGDMRQSVEAGLKAAELSPDHFWVHYGLARAYLGLKDVSQARAHAEKAAALAPSDALRADIAKLLDRISKATR